MNRSPKIYAIDYGTSNSLVNAASETEHWKDIPLGGQEPILKSILYTPSADTWYYGSQAIKQYLEQPTQGRLFKSLKRFLPDPSFEGTRIFTEFVGIQDLIAKQLRYMRSQANDYLQCDVNSVVLGCPALFSDSEPLHDLALRRLKAAAIAAGFKTVEFCPEPIAAAYRFRRELNKESLVLVADFGGGTSDFTVLKLSRQLFQPSDVLALGGVSVAGDRYDGDLMRDFVAPHLGSKLTYRKPMTRNDLKFPKALIRKMCHPADIVFLDNNSVHGYLKDAQRYLNNPDQRFRIDTLLTIIEERLGYALFNQVENCKIKLTDQDRADFAFHYPTAEIEASVSQEEFIQASQTTTAAILSCLDQTLNKAGCRPQDIDIVCVTGGTAYIPAIHAGLKTRFGDKLQMTQLFHSVVDGLVDRGQQLLAE